jgi:hypothetical protein
MFLLCSKFGLSQRGWPMGMRRGDEGAFVDIDTGALRRDRLLIQRGAGAILFLGLGRQARQLGRLALGEDDLAPDTDSFFSQCRLIAEILEDGDTHAAKMQRSAAPTEVHTWEDLVLRRLAVAEALAKAGYNPDEARDERGRWTGDGEHSLAAIASTAVGAAEDFIGIGTRNATSLLRSSASVFGDVSPSVLVGLADMGAGFAAPTLALGILFIPTNRTDGVFQRGTLPGGAGVSYSFNRQTGEFRLTQDAGPVVGDMPLYTGTVQPDGTLRDADGRAIGREVAGSIILDPDALTVQIAGTPEGNARRLARARATADAAQPNLCPDPDFDRPGARLKDYKFQRLVSLLINPDGPAIPPGIAVRLPRKKKDGSFDPDNINDWVYFDECRRSDDTLIDAKGTGYEKLLTSKYEFLRNGVTQKLLKQGDAQVAAAGGLKIEWHFAEEKAAEIVKKLFADNKIDIKVVWEH